MWLPNKLSFTLAVKLSTFFPKFLANIRCIPIYKNRMQQKFRTEPVELDKPSQMFKYLIGEKPDFECHGEQPVPGIQFFPGTWTFELELIVYPACLPGQTGSSQLVVVSLPGSPFLTLFVLIRLIIKDETAASADINKARRMPGLVRIKPACRECSCSECEDGVSVVKSRRRVRWSWVPSTELGGESWQLTEP